MIPGRNSTEKKAREKVYICSPYQILDDEDVDKRYDENIGRAQAYAEYAIACGLAPVVPHLYIPAIIGDEGETREVGLECSCSLVIGCKQIWVCTEEQSEGMRREVETARRYGVEVVQAWQDPGASIYLAKWGL